MKVPELERGFCGACNLRTATKIIAVILVVFDIYNLYVIINSSNEYYKFVEELKKIHPNLTASDPSKLIKFQIVWFGINCVLHVLLLLAAFGKWASIVCLWIIGACISLAIVLGLLLHQLLNGALINGQFILLLLVYAVKVYFMVVVYNFYRELKKDSTAESGDSRA